MEIYCSLQTILILNEFSFEFLILTKMDLTTNIFVSVRNYIFDWLFCHKVDSLIFRVIKNCWKGNFANVDLEIKVWKICNDSQNIWD